MTRRLFRYAWALLLILPAMMAPQVARGSEYTVRIVSDYQNLRMVFEPAYLRIQPGDRVIWINQADEEHNVATFPDGYPRGANGFQSRLMMRAGETFSHQFDMPGTYEYHCMPHLVMGMRGMIVVGRASASHQAHEPSTAELRKYKDALMEWFDSEEIEALLRERNVSN